MGSGWTLSVVCVAVMASRPLLAQDSPDVLMIAVDSLRPDALGCYGGPGDLSPTLDQLAAEGVVFERTFATSSWAVPATLTLLTGHRPSALWPRDWAGRLPGLRIPETVTTLASVLEEHGYTTLGFSGQSLVHRRRFAHGFDHFVELWRGAADRVDRLQPFRSALAAVGDGPMFTYVHLSILTSVHSGNPSADVDAPPPTQTPEQLREKRGRYRAAMESTDTAIATLRELFEELGRTPDVILVVGVNGLGLGRHGRPAGVGHSLSNELLHVPWIVHAPGRLDPGRCGAVVSTIAVAPTLLEVLGLDGIGSGRSAMPLVRGEELDQRLAYSEFPLYPDPSGRAIQDAHWKLVLPDRLQPDVELFELAEDPQELAPQIGDTDALDQVQDRLWDELLRRVRADARTRESWGDPDGVR